MSICTGRQGSSRTGEDWLANGRGAPDSLDFFTTERGYLVDESTMNRRLTRFWSHTAHVLTTARLWIRPFTLDDVPDATAAVGLLMDSDERNREWIARLGVDHQREHGYAYWQCRDKGKGQLLGFCGWREHDLGASLGYAFAERTRDNGYAKEAARAVVAWGLANIGAERLYASVRPPNPASCKVLEHAGMTLMREYVDAHGPRLIYAPPGRPPLPQTR